MKNSLPFSINGIYAKKINPEEDLQNYKSSKKEKVWNVFKGKHNQHFYEILWFAKNKDEKFQDLNEVIYCAGFQTVTGELLNISDRTYLSWHFADFKKVRLDGNYCYFEDDELKFYCYSHYESIFVGAERKTSGKVCIDHEKFQFVSF